jgi:hypothetical protein
MNVKNKNIEQEILKLYKPIAEDTNLTLNSKLIGAYIYNREEYKLECNISSFQIGRNLKIEVNSVNSSLIELHNNGYLSYVSKGTSAKIITVLLPNIFLGDYYAFDLSIIKSDLKISSKFLLAYTMSQHPDDSIIFGPNDNILAKLGNPVGGFEIALNELIFNKFINMESIDGIIKISPTKVALDDLGQALYELKDLKTSLSKVISFHQNAIDEYLKIDLDIIEPHHSAYCYIIEHHQNSIVELLKKQESLHVEEEYERQSYDYMGNIIKKRFHYTIDLEIPSYMRINGEVYAATKTQAITQVELKYLNQIKGWLEIYSHKFRQSK